jgi:hypothetical protein
MIFGVTNHITPFCSYTTLDYCLFLLGSPRSDTVPPEMEMRTGNCSARRTQREANSQTVFACPLSRRWVSLRSASGEVSTGKMCLPFLQWNLYTTAIIQILRASVYKWSAIAKIWRSVHRYRPKAKCSWMKHAQQDLWLTVDFRVRSHMWGLTDHVFQCDNN